MTHYDYQCNCPNTDYRFGTRLDDAHDVTCVDCNTRLVQVRVVAESHYKANKDVQPEQPELLDLHVDDNVDLDRMGL